MDKILSEIDSKMGHVYQKTDSKIDKDTGFPHTYKHDVREDEVKDVLQNSGYELTGKPLKAYRRNSRRRQRR